jgi:hypothetical protein
VGSTYVKPHYVTRGGKRFKVKGHRRRTVGSAAKGRSGVRFRKLASEVAAEYRRKGYPKERAEYIGRATAGKVFWRKFGYTTGRRILRRER